MCVADWARFCLAIALGHQLPRCRSMCPHHDLRVECTWLLEPVTYAQLLCMHASETDWTAWRTRDESSEHAQKMHLGKHGSKCLMMKQQHQLLQRGSCRAEAYSLGRGLGLPEAESEGDRLGRVIVLPLYVCERKTGALGGPLSP